MVYKTTAQRLDALMTGTQIAVPTREVVDGALCMRSLFYFVKRAWEIVEPGETFRENWHIAVICNVLQALTMGKLDPKVVAQMNPQVKAAMFSGGTLEKDVLINVPPGAMKSLLVNVCWPAWTWILDPSKRFFGASYGEDLSTRDAVKARLIIDSEWYQKLWGEQVKLDAAQNQKRYYQNMGGGWRLATSVGGRGTGEHPDFKIVDDPHTAKEAVSDADRKAALDWFDQTLTSRGATRNARTVVIMQRLHHNDLSGHIINSPNFKRDWG